MSKPNLTSDVLNAVRSGKFSANEISRFVLADSKNSVRSALARLTKQGKIQRISRGRYTPIEVEEPLIFSSKQVYRHYLADTKYKRGIAAIFYTLEDTDEEDMMIQTLGEQLPFEYIDTFGYSKELVDFNNQDLESVEFVGFDY